MKARTEWQFIALVPAFLFLGMIPLFLHLDYKSPIFAAAIAVIGLSVFMTRTYLRYGFNKEFMYTALGIFFTMVSYMAVFILMRPYPDASMVIFFVAILLSILFLGLGAFTKTKNLFSKFK
jgi:hypothetical protein